MKKHMTSFFVFLLLSALIVQPVFADPFDDDTDLTDLPAVENSDEQNGTEAYEGDNNWTYDRESGNAEDPDASLAQTNIETMVTNNVGGDAAKNAGNDTKHIPDTNPFDGNNITFDGNDGTKTAVYDSGAVLTDNGDGSKTGVDKDGTYVTVDKDGIETYHFNDGTIGKKYPDGRKEEIYSDGSKLIYNADGSMSTYEAAGYYTDLDDDGNVKSVYYENGQRIDFYDENGNFKIGEQTIQGPGGETVTYKFDGGDTEDGFDVNEISITVKGNGIEAGFKLTADGEGNGTYEQKSADGATFSMSVNGENNFSIDGVSGDGKDELHIKQTENQLSVNSKDENGSINLEGTVSKDGTNVKMSATNENGTTTIEATLDEDGNLKSGSFKNGDGSYLTRNEDGSIEFSNPKTGALLKKDGDGNYLSVHLPMKNNSSYDYNEGTGVLVDNEKGYKVMWTHDENGNLVIAAPSGKYTVDENGNLFKDGQPVMVDGKQVNVNTGFNRGEFSEAPSFIETICGTYPMACQLRIIGGGNTVFSDTDSKESSAIYDITISDAGDGQANFTLANEEGEVDTVTAAVDEANSKITFVFPYGYGYYYTDSYMTFDISGNSVNATLHMYGEGEDWNEEFVAESIDGTGCKQ